MGECWITSSTDVWLDCWVTPTVYPNLSCYCGTVMKYTLYRVSRLYVVFSSCAVFLAFCWGCYLVLDAVFFNSLGRLQSLAVGLGVWLLVFLFVPAIYKLGTTKITNEFVWQGSLFKNGKFFVIEKLAWDEMSSFMVSAQAFRLVGKSVSMEVNLAFYGQPQCVREFVLAKLSGTEK